jgi:uncharacterized protein (DUF1778 family)
MSVTKKEHRYELRWQEETHKLAERAALAGGYGNIKEYLARLVNDDAPKVIEAYASIKVTTAQFDHFMTVCGNPPKASAKLRAAAKALDDEGIVLDVSKLHSK